MNHPLKIIFAGTPAFAVPALQALMDSEHECCAVYTQPDRPAGRGRKVQHGPVKACALLHGIPVIQPETLKTDEARQQLADFAADLMVVAAYGLILPKAILDTPRLGCINVHASLLPRWRGAAPIQRAIEAGDAETGITIMQMNEGLDTGDMLLKKRLSIGLDETAAALHERLAVLGGIALNEALTELVAGSACHTQQDEQQAVYAKKLSKQEAEINWNESATSIVRRICAFNPWPVAQTTLKGKQLRLWKAVVLQDAGAEVSDDTGAGQVLAESAAGIDVAAGEGVVRLLEIQLPGKKSMPVEHFVHASSMLAEKLG